MKSRLFGKFYILLNKFLYLKKQIKRLIKVENKLFNLQLEYEKEIEKCNRFKKFGYKINSILDYKKILKFAPEYIASNFYFEKCLIFIKQDNKFILKSFFGCNEYSQNLKTELQIVLTEKEINLIIEQKVFLLEKDKCSLFNDIIEHSGLDICLISPLITGKSPIFGILVAGYSKYKYSIYPTITNPVKNLFMNISLYISLSLKNSKLIQNLKEKEILEKEHNEKNNLFVNIAHETKTPIMLISNYLNKYIKENGINEDLEIIKHKVDKLQRDIVNFLDLEKLKKGLRFYYHSEELNLSKLLEIKIKLFNEIAAKKEIIIFSNIEENLYTKIDHYAMDRVINNLIDNAIRYTEENGKISILLFSKKDKIMLKITDTGIGISEDKIKHIFQPYYQMKHKKRNIDGIGMGLNIVKNIIDDVKGELLLESKINTGTTFTVILSRYKSENKKNINNLQCSEIINSITNLKLKKENYINGKNNILIIEDNIEMLAFLQNYFINDYNVFYSINAKDALEKITKIPKPDLIISDLMMDEMNGFELLKELKKNNHFSAIPFIFITAKTTIDDKITGLFYGAVDFIFKPFLIEELAFKIKSILANLKQQQLITKNQLEQKILNIIYKGKNEKQVENANIFNIFYKYKFSKREEEVAKLLYKGLQYKEISYILKISEKTVSVHASRIYKKLNVHGKFEFLNLINNFK